MAGLWGDTKRFAHLIDHEVPKVRSRQIAAGPLHKRFDCGLENAGRFILDAIEILILVFNEVYG